jgi:hypothetical protein
MNDMKAYRFCRFCNGAGCVACPGEADKAYNEQFPDGPKPLATFKLDDAADMEIAKQTIGGEAMKHAYSEGGGGLEEIIENLRKAGKLEL